MLSPFLFIFYMATRQELLDKVNTAIDARLTGGGVASYSIGGRNLQYVSLTELFQIRDKLQTEISGEKGSRNFASFRRPT